MLTRTCNGCAQRIADDDTHALRDLPMSTPARPAELIDWCGDCVAIIRAELPGLAVRAREARRAAASAPVRERALRLWPGPDSRARG